MSEIKQLQKKLCYQKKNGLLSDRYDFDTIESFSKDYIEFLRAGKTERLCVKKALELAEKKGFSEFDHTREYKTGDKVYVNNHGKSLALAVIGKHPVENGTHIAAAHIDSPRLDLKPITMAELKNISGLPYRLHSTVFSAKRTVQLLRFQLVKTKTSLCL